MFAKCRILLGLFALGATFAAHADITGAGSSAAKPLYNLWAEEYAKSGNPKLDYQPVGSSAGIKQIKERAVDFGASDVAMSIEDRKANKLICFPSAISGVVPVINLPGIKPGEVQMTGEVLADIFARKVTRWNDPEIAAINPGLALPKLPIVAVVRSDGSGTTYNFTDYLVKMSKAWKDTYGRNFTIMWAADTTPAKGSGGVVAAVKQTPGAIGYVDYNYVVQEKLTYTKVQNRDGKFVTPGSEGFASALNNSSWKTQATFEEMLTDKPGLHTWPITMGTFVMVPQSTNAPEKTIAALKFFTWAFLKGDKLVGNIDFVRLPDRVQARIYNELTQITDVKGQPLHWTMQ
ncbi:MAG TPA: phosphate ABC transporter substrate-binding protein PstS [Burkholderiaceae bacterium]